VVGKVRVRVIGEVDGEEEGRGEEDAAGEEGEGGGRVDIRWSVAGWCMSPGLRKRSALLCASVIDFIADKYVSS